MKAKKRRNRYTSKKLSPISEDVFIEIIEIFKEFEEEGECYERRNNKRRKNKNRKK